MSADKINHQHPFTKNEKKSLSDNFFDIRHADFSFFYIFFFFYCPFLDYMALMFPPFSVRPASRSASDLLAFLLSSAV